MKVPKLFHIVTCVVLIKICISCGCSIYYVQHINSTQIKLFNKKSNTQAYTLMLLGEDGNEDVSNNISSNSSNRTT